MKIKLTESQIEQANHDGKIKLTEKVKAALRVLDIDVLDHVILTKDGYYSYKWSRKPTDAEGSVGGMPIINLTSNHPKHQYYDNID